MKTIRCKFCQQPTVRFEDTFEPMANDPEPKVYYCKSCQASFYIPAPDQEITYYDFVYQDYRVRYWSKDDSTCVCKFNYQAITCFQGEKLTPQNIEKKLPTLLTFS